MVPQKQIGRTSSGENSLFSPLAISQSKRPTPTTLFRYSDQAQILFGKHTKKEFGRTLRGKSGFPSDPQGTEGRCPCEAFTLLGKTDRLSRSCFAEVVIRGARAASRSELSFYSDQAQILFSNSKSPGSIRKKNLVGLTGESPVSPLFR